MTHTIHSLLHGHTRFVAAVLGCLAPLGCSGEDPVASPSTGMTGVTGVGGATSTSTTTTTSASSAGPATGSTATGTTGQGTSNTTASATAASTTSPNGASTMGFTTTMGAATTTGAATTSGAGGATQTTSGSEGSVGGTASGTMTTTVGTGGTTMIPDEGDRSVEGVCARWNADTANMSEGTWSGNIATCDAGDISAEGRENALRLFNLDRWLADLPAVVTDPERNQQAQECALMMDANNDLSHEPPTSWTCYSETGAQGARTSNISSGPGVSSVAGYMIDIGNESTMGHRRIILSNWLGPIGLGSTGQNGSSCMQNIGGTGKAGKEWVAWPPPGVFPIQAYSNTWSSLSDTGWSIQSEDIQLGSSQVTVTSSGGDNLSVTTTALTGNYGSTNGIRVALNGWDVEAGETYTVSVSGTDITYDINIVDCDQY